MSPAVNDELLRPGLVDTVPQVFSAAVNEPTFSYEGTLEATVCLCRQARDDRWHAGDIDFPTTPIPTAPIGSSLSCSIRPASPITASPRTTTANP
ncbi:hypothetical protein Ait01nite_097460 [Actinoplanes italicus]|nr:hypothetical protein Ait01nite_097460 [Actinoplanes italicus]